MMAVAVAAGWERVSRMITLYWTGLVMSRNKVSALLSWLSFNPGYSVAGAEAGGLMESLSLLIRTLLGGHQDDLDEEEEGSGSVSLDIRPDSLLDVVLNIIPNTVAGITGFSQQEEEDYFYDELNQVGITGDPSDGGSTVGGMTISLHSMDLAKLFVEVQKSIIENTTGFNCSCGEDILNEESIKNATFSLLEEAVEEKRKRQLSLKKKKRSYLRSRIPKLLQI